MGKLSRLGLAALALAGCGGEDESTFDDVEATSAAIINGSTSFTGYLNEKIRTVRIGGLLDCSGVVLRPNVVLTARHCATLDQTIGGPPLQDWQMHCNNRQSTKIFLSSASIDAAVVIFDGNVVSQDLDFTAIDPAPATKYVNGPTLAFMGYAASSTIRKGTGKVTAAHQTYSAVGGTGRGSFLTDLVNGSVTEGGDSGGPLWGEDHYPRPVAAVVSASNPTPGGRTIFAEADDFRHGVRTFVADNVNHGLSLMFDSASDINHFTQVQGRTGTAPNWSVTGGSLVQGSNAPQAMMIQKGVFENVFISTGVVSTDADPLGVVVRFVDKDNYYRCEANVNNHTLKLMQRRAGVESELKSVAWNGSFNGTVIQAYADENKVTCKAGSSVTTGEVTVPKPTFPIGRIGLYNHFNNGGKFTHYGAAQRPPLSGTW
jgi:hypothetical protein